MTGLIERDRASVAAIGKLRFFDVAFTAGEGCELIAEDGRRFLDLTSGACAASLGYGHPLLVEAVTQAVRAMPGAGNLTLPNPQAIALAEELLAAHPYDAPRKVWLGHAASDATETAIAALRAATGRSRVITFLGGYHGGTAGSMAVSAKSPYAHTPTGAGNVVLPYPNDYRPSIPGGPEAVSRLPRRAAGDDLPTGADGGADLRADPLRRRHDDAARRLPGGAGRALPPARDRARRRRGQGRHRSQRPDARVALGRREPDVAILGKGLGGGLPISAVIGPAEVMDFRERFAMQTTHGNPVSAAAARAVLRAIETEGLVANAREVGDALAAGLRELAERHPSIGDVRGHGLAIGVDLVTDRESREPDAELAARVVASALEHGAIMFRIGVHENVLQLTPSLTFSRADAQRARRFSRARWLTPRKALNDDQSGAGPGL